MEPSEFAKSPVFADQMIPFVISSFIIFVYAIVHFSPPPERRSQTTRVRYLTFASFYVVLFYLLFCSLVLAPELLQFLVKNVFRTELLDPDLVKNLSPPYLVLLFLTLALPKIPYLRGLDETALQVFHRSAAIPAKARALSAELREAGYDVARFADGEIAAQVRSHFTSKGVREEFITFDGRAPEVIDIWLRVTALIYTIERNNGNPLTPFLSKFQGERNVLLKRHRNLDEKAFCCIAVRQRFEIRKIKDITNLLRAFEDDFLEDAERFFKDVLDLYSRALLSLRHSESRRRKLINELGFDMATPGGCGIGVDHYVVILFSVFAFMVVTFLIMEFAFGWELVSSGMLVLALRIAIFHTIGVACAFYPKSIWPQLCWSGTGIRPLAYYLVVVVVTGVVCFFLGITFDYLTKQSIEFALAESQIRWRWLILPCSTALMAAWITDNVSGGGDRRMRWAEIVGHGAVTVAAAILVIVLFRDIPESKLPPEIPFLSAALLFGFTLGWMVPSAFRDKTHERNMLEEVLDRDRERMKVLHEGRLARKRTLSQPTGAENTLANETTAMAAGRL